ncbi:MAG TPA: peptide chain release factor N(5)-glutamine methyltransferase [Jiangellales bacterium]|nr:peptide chain release factor N(5)-glutamine methyltransferase [Jiangellales bacterium]
MSRLSRAVGEAARTLAAAGVPSPRHDAEELAAYVLGVTRGDLWRHDEVADGYADAVARRAAREPLQHITGRTAFRHVEVRVGPGVFVPRPETEVVAGAAVEAARAAGPAPVVVDLCTGSGAIALAVADEVPGARVHAVESESAALGWARLNLAGSPIDLRAGDMAAAFTDLDGEVDVVVSNPPYIPAGAHVRDPEVAEHDPAPALWSGPDGLDAIRVVARVAARLLRTGGCVVVEHADLQGESAPAVFAVAGGWVEVRDHADLAGRPRFVTARRGERQP